MSEERRRILDLLAEGKISVDEAERLLAAASGTSSVQEESLPMDPEVLPHTETERPKVKNPKWLRVLVTSNKEGREGKVVNIRIPLGLIKAGAKLGSIMPKSAKAKFSASLEEKGVEFNLDDINAQNIDELISHLNDMVIDVNDNEEQVRIFCE